MLLVFFEIKHEIDLHAIHFKLHSIIIKFPTLEISIEWSGSTPCTERYFERNLFIMQGVAAWKLKGNLYFLCSLPTQSSKHMFWL